MNNAGDAADQVVRMSLEGFEVAARLTGSAVKNLAAALNAVLKEEKRTKGKARLANMIKSGKPLKVFSVLNKDFNKFKDEAKRYGVLYSVLTDRSNLSPNSEVDIIVREEDASKIQRIVDRFKLSTVDKAAVVKDVERSISERDELYRDIPEKSRESRYEKESKDKPVRKDRSEPENPSVAKTEKSPLSRQASEDRSSRSGQGRVILFPEQKPSVRAEIERYKQQNKRLSEPAQDLSKPQKEPVAPKNGQTVHQQPKKKRNYNKER